MNWDISIGHGKQWYGRMLQGIGRRFDRRRIVLDGERIEFTGRLQMRYGLLKHQAQWGSALLRLQRQPMAVSASAESSVTGSSGRL